MAYTVYDWDELLRLRSAPRTLVRGVDFTCLPNTMRALVEENANKRGLRSRSTVRGDRVTYSIYPAPRLAVDGL